MHDLVIRNGKIVDGTGAPAIDGHVAIDGDRIVGIGHDVGRGKREIDADGRLVTPGFVDAHTHYDGQVVWDPDLAPSSWHGVTTVVMGNCGVGFAPARPEERDFLIRTMEGVEEIPGAALAVGMSWDWESFPEYLDAVDRQDRSIDVVAQVPHSALRCYVMGEERALDDEATAADIAEMARLTAEAVDAGALGFSTSRTIIHRVKNGPEIPGTFCRPEELVGIARSLHGTGAVFQMISDLMGAEPDFAWMKEIARTSGRPLVMSLTRRNSDPESYRDTLDRFQRAWETEGLDIRAGVGWRPPGVLMGLQATLNPLMTHPTFRTLRDLPFAERLQKLRDPETRRAILDEELSSRDPFARRVFRDWGNMFPLGDPPEYEPVAAASVAGRAAAAGVTPEAFVYDAMLAGDGTTLLYYPLQGYSDYTLDPLHEMMAHPRSVASLSDGGAHVGTVADASFCTYMLTHWVRDRTQGPRFDLEEAIRLQTSDTAHLYGLDDRGVLAPGKKADVNVIDLDALHLHGPYMAFDLPGDNKRLLQRADGYTATVVSGDVIAEDGEMTSARPGRLVRGPRS